MPRPGRDRDLRPCARRHAGSARHFHPRLRSAGCERHRRRHRLCDRGAPGDEYRPHRDHPDAASARRPVDRQAGREELSALMEGFDPLALLAKPEYVALFAHGLEMTFVIAAGSWLLGMLVAVLLLAGR